jgi:hypothetical protein
MHACVLASLAEDAAAAAAASCSPRAAPAVLDVNTCAPLQHAKKNEVRAEAARKKQEEAAAAAAKDARVSASPRSTDKSAPRSTDKKRPASTVLLRPRRSALPRNVGASRWIVRPRRQMASRGWRR